MHSLERKRILTALSIETILVLSGVSTAMKKWSPKSALMLDITTGLSSNFSVLLTQEVLEEVSRCSHETAPTVME